MNDFAVTYFIGATITPRAIADWVEQSLVGLFDWLQQQKNHDGASLVPIELLHGALYATTHVVPNGMVLPVNSKPTRAKRLRPWLLFWAARLLATDDKKICHTALALELLHGYSLVHDDLPAMDDDDVRRGRPALHRAFTPPLTAKENEALAILVGDLLQGLAFEVIAMDKTPTADEKNNLLLGLARAGGMVGMVAGQWRDLVAHRTITTAQQVAMIKAQKTGALIEFAMTAPLGLRLGLMAKNYPVESWQKSYHSLARLVGHYYQSVDDVLDETADLATMGKKTHKDRAMGKITTTSLLGLDGAKKEVVATREKIFDLIDNLRQEKSAPWKNNVVGWDMLESFITDLHGRV